MMSYNTSIYLNLLKLNDKLSLFYSRIIVISHLKYININRGDYIMYHNMRMGKITNYHTSQR